MINMPCSCGFSTEYPECNGTHKIVKKVRDQIVKDIEAINLSEGSNTSLNALGMKMLAIEIASGKKK
jgi:hypothetical protein